MITKHITFRNNTMVFHTAYIDMTIDEIEKCKNRISRMYRINKDEIEVVFEDRDLSDYDLTEIGISIWTKPFAVVKGVGLAFKLGSDEHLDCILNDTMENYLTFV